DAVNDQSAGEDDPGMLALVAERGAGIVLMHRLRPPSRDAWSTGYGNAAPDYTAAGGVVEAVLATLSRCVAAAVTAGVPRDSIVIDPGLGFGKTVAQNFELIAATHRLAALGLPVVCAASRKSFVGAATGVEAPVERVEGSIAIAVA